MPQLVFEDGDKGKGDLIHLLKTQDYAAPIFKPKRSRAHKKSGFVIEGAVPLQAADLLAYEIFSLCRIANVEPYARINRALFQVPGALGTIEPSRPKFVKEGLEQAESLIMRTDLKVIT